MTGMSSFILGSKCRLLTVAFRTVGSNVYEGHFFYQLTADLVFFKGEKVSIDEVYYFLLVICRHFPSG